MSQEQVARVPGYCGPGSESELIEGVCHFMLVERPDEINNRVLGFLRRTQSTPRRPLAATT
jgi:pimeloyl-ACP methyl ester carboxylesterase